VKQMFLSSPADLYLPCESKLRPQLTTPNVFFRHVECGKSDP